ncbi:hypothetical protein C8A05DRAFT_17220 [Staphylotrichum tortipilum]|uniref:Uncharacterized protein n=1 Tax=Staphylotrichum tortipilum TaxID=2831512 RepID=A0AAN6MGW4_9PEZI|nr:hypothetical protein C8A05DRAFT_17220 [Staphylotrichum longicolle]
MFGFHSTSDTPDAVMNFDVLEPSYPLSFPNRGEGIRTVPLPGVKCKTCEANGEEVWVVEGLKCGKCGTATDDDLATRPWHDDGDEQRGLEANAHQCGYLPLARGPACHLGSPCSW